MSCLVRPVSGRPVFCRELRWSAKGDDWMAAWKAGRGSVVVLAVVERELAAAYVDVIGLTSQKIRWGANAPVLTTYR